MDFIDEVINIIRSSPDIPTSKRAADGTLRLRRRAGHRHRPDAYGQLSESWNGRRSRTIERPSRPIAELEGILADEGKIRPSSDECLKMRDNMARRRTHFPRVSGEVDVI